MDGYCFVCGYCDTTLITPYQDMVAAHRHAQEQGWRMTHGTSRVFGEGAQNTCPRCVGDDIHAVSMFVSREVSLRRRVKLKILSGN